jgi:glycosyltransferase involved in cell wall biosynthesis
MSWKDAAVSSRIQGFPNLMRDGIDGLLFPVGDYRALSECLKKLLADEPMRRCLACSARSFAEKFDWTDVARQTANVYKAMLNKS